MKLSLSSALLLQYAEVYVTSIAALASAIETGDRRALARALTLVERGGPDVRTLRHALRHTHSGHVVGITGAPGAGKSTLTTALAQALRAAQLTVGIIAIDPSSPLSGGSLLGDRIRMYDLAGDQGVFIRSMANRGRLGGLAAATTDASFLMGAAGFDIVLLETVGAGQSDVAVADVADTVLLVEAPGMGDEVQSIKAGILEVADVIVVNKSDRPDAQATLHQLQALVRMNHAADDLWQVPVLGVSALVQIGITELRDALLRHREWLKVHPNTPRQYLRRRQALQRTIEIRVMESIQCGDVWDDTINQLRHTSVDVDALATNLLNTWQKSHPTFD
jgi:LAO/AO transport system kinase